ncbi:type I polyketide synthase [Streptomyces sp. NBUA17]|uniref:type I polyketide synthase n=1 Tax=Streptomyces sp. NBUA17 TaxID=3062275 RepID=UPI0037D9F6E2
MTASVDRLTEALRASLLANKKLKQENRALTEAAQDPVVLVGMACRFPGGVHGPEDLWRLVANGEEGIGPFPVDRSWDLDALLGTDGPGSGTSATGEGGFLDGAGEFDAEFFRMSPREALATDPQQRLLLEVSWEALERAGIVPSSLAGSRTGVFAGVYQSGYNELLSRADEQLRGHQITGGAPSVISGRVSYTLGLEGPAVSVDTGCSSSLVSMHLAAQALRTGECTLALAGGVAVMAASDAFVGFTAQGGLAADGRCKSFADAADGTGWSEGVGMVVMERLSAARRHGHQVLAVFRSSAINQDGASNGLTAPNGPSQQRVIRQALAAAGLSAADIDAVEAHGTGTKLGDPIEAQALLATYGQDRPEGRPLWLGSLKSNIGHTQAAAGVGGVIKMVMALRHGVLPKTLHVDAPTTQVDWARGDVRLLTESRPWTGSDHPRRVGVSSFGVSGTNAHVILEAPAEEDSPTVVGNSPAGEDTSTGVGSSPAAPSGPSALGTADLVPWILSGTSEDAVRAQAAKLLAHLTADPVPGPVDVGWSLLTTREIFEYRAVLLGTDRDELLTGLRTVASGEPGEPGASGASAPGPALGRAAEDTALGVLFTGQGAQRVGMARGLYAESPVFAQALDDILAELDPLLERPLREVMWGEDAELINETGWAQPALFAVEAALFEVLRAFGVTPDYLLGHSIGEVTAAYVAGVWSPADACRVVAARARLMQALPSGGAMAAIPLPEAEVAEMLPESVSVAAVNTADSVVISGPREAVDAVVESVSGQGHRVSRLRLSHAFHSSLMEPMLARFRRVLESVRFAPPRIPVVSNLTGARATDEELCSPEYWTRQVRSAVRFADGVRWLGEQGVTALVELGPDGVLSGLARQSCPPEMLVVPLLRRERGDVPTLASALAHLCARGVEVDWTTLFAGRAVMQVPLPTYAFRHQRYWRTSGDSADVSAAGLTAAGHPLLGAMLPLPQTDGLVFTGRLSVRTHPWLADHRVRDAVVFPGAGLVELVVRAGDSAGCDRLEELVLETPLVLPAHGAAQLQVVVGEDDAHRRTVTVYARPDGEETWTRHATGAVGPAPAGTADSALFDVLGRQWPPADAAPLDTERFYELLGGGEFAYGPAFRGLREAWRDGDRILAEIELPEPGRPSAESFGIHPALLDGALHALVFADLESAPVGWLPFSFADVVLRASGATRLRVALTRTGPDEVTVAAADDTGQPVLSIGSLTVRPLAAGNLTAHDAGTLLKPEWTEVAGTAAPVDEWLAADPADVTAVPAGAEPRAVVLTVCGDPEEEVVAATHELTAHVLRQLQRWLSDDRFGSVPLVVATSGAVAVEREPARDLAAAAVWGLVRSAQTEHPGRLVLLDTDSAVDAGLLGRILAADEPQQAVRGGRLLAARLTRTGAADELALPPDTPWRLESTGKGVLENLALLPCPEAAEPLETGQVRVRVHAAGLNFRDVLNALGMYPGQAGPLGGEAAGVVTGTGPGVTGLRVGDRVMGLVHGGFGPVAVTDHRLLTAVPDGWSLITAASVPIAFLTARYGLGDLAGLRTGESVLVHAAAGGVGLAAVQLAQYFGAEVHATASEGKWEFLREWGVDAGRVHSSRTLDFRDRMRATTDGRGVDVVLNSLAGDFVDASLDVLAPGGRFLEMGKADIRPADSLTDRCPGLSYRAFDLTDAGADRIQELLRELVTLFEAGVLRPLPVTTWDVRQAPEAFRYMSRARHVGKLVLTVPHEPDPAGTVVITGGTGALGAVVARHLVGEHGIRHLMLLSRRGPDAPGAAELTAELARRGADVTVTACDVTDRRAVADALGSVAPEHPLTGVVHTAGVVDDGVLGSLSRDRMDRVLAPKADAAWHLHELTRDLDLSLFLVFSSLSGLLGSGGQANYAAGNAFLDALMRRRRREGLPGLSMAWGPWTTETGMTGALSPTGLKRLARSGMPPLTTEQGMDLFDRATRSPQPVLGLARLDLPALRRQGDVPVWRAAGGRRRAAHRRPAGTRPVGRLASMPTADRERALTELVRESAATVLGHSSATGIDPARLFSDLGFDSLTAVELRNLIQARTGIALAVGVVFDHPTVTRLAGHLADRFRDPRTTDPTRPAAVAEPQTAAADPIVLVGMACRLPGGVTGPDDLWRLVSEAGDGIGPFPVDRGWDLAELVGPNGTGLSATGEGGFLTGADAFDAPFFRISPREAVATDPQQRLLLEVSWEALEQAGILPESLAGSRTGVFTGAYQMGYGELVARSDDQLRGHQITGGATSVISGRVSYTLGLEGPAVSVDTACSSSLVAMHLAAQALRSGECSLALAGGVTVMATPEAFVGFTLQGGLSADGRCRSFAETANGTGWSEGVGVVVLERLSDARRNGHEVLAVLRSSAVNQDGASNGLTAPNGPSQQRVIRQALAAAGLSAADVDVVEAHGTGTRLGDPIEADALLATYGQDRVDGQPLWLGSLKSNIGHAQAAAGAAGVIKTVLALRHGVLPKTLHAERPTTRVDWARGEVRLLTEAMSWPETGRPRRAGVSSFGVSGTNAHVILEAAPGDERRGAPESPAVLTTAVPWVLSGRTPEALRAQAARLLEHLEGAPSVRAVDVGWSLATSRTAFEHRAVVVGGDREELIGGVRALADGALGAVRGTARGEQRLGVLFTGQGAQRVGMARGLYGESPVFAAALEEVCAELDPLLERPLREVMWGEDAGLVDETGWAQPALFAVEVALFEVLRAFGGVPDFLLGHSIGEVAAAYVAGVWSLGDACRVVAARARLMQALPSGGAMAAVGVSEAEIGGLLPTTVSVAAVNTADSVVVSGPRDDVEQVLSLAARRAARVSRLRVSHAFHSPAVDPMLDEFRRVLESVRFAAPRIPIVSNVTGVRATDDELCAPEYWVRQARSAVRFADGVRWLAEQGVTTMVELGPDGALSGPAQDGPGVTAVPMLRRRDSGVPGDSGQVLSALGQLFALGVAVDWTAAFAGRGAVRVPLPTYAFRHQRYWPDTVRAAPQPSEDQADRRFWASVEHQDVRDLATTLGVDGGVVAPVLPALASWRARRHEESLADGRRYREAWKRLAVTGAPTTGRWVVVVPESARDDAWAAEVAGALSADTLVLDADDAELTERLRDAGRSAARVTGVVSLAAALEPNVTAALAATASLLRAVPDSGLAARIWAVTRGAVSVGPHDPVTAPEQGGVWGLGRVAALELPALWGGLADLPEVLDPRSARGLAAALSGAAGTAGMAGEDQIAVRPAGVFGRRLVHAPATSSDAPSWTTSGTALVTGGTGELGAYAARWLVERGAEHVVLVSRRGLDAEGADALRLELEVAGARVTVAACDVTDRQALAEVVAGMPEEWPLRTVVHAAGAASEDRALTSVTADDLDRLTRAKVHGARHLDEITSGLELDAFVLFCSGAGVWGSGGQAGLAAADACLESLARHRRALGRTATAVAWGSWDQVGALSEPDAAQREQLRLLGVVPLRPESAVAALQRAVHDDETAIVVADLDWARFTPVFTAARPSALLSGLPEAEAALAAPREDTAASGELRDRLAALSGADRRQVLIGLVRDASAAVLGHAPDAGIDGDQPFSELGFDSLTAVELRNRLQAATGAALPASLVFDHPTAHRLADHLAGRFGASEPAGEVAEPAPVPVAGDPIVLVGMACRFPGGAASPDALWRLVADGADGITPFPADRGWDLDTLLGTGGPGSGTSATGEGGFLDEIADFDAEFFRMSPREALATDPQQRLLLEVTWEALERAGIDPTSLAGSPTGVFAGAYQSGYLELVSRADERLRGHALTGGAGSVISGRIAYTLGLEGPAVSVDTACSSSLVAMHLAAQALRSGECSLALAGGVTVMAAADTFVGFSIQGGLAADGRCRSFSDDADGTGWSEGVGVVVLERLSDARRNGHEVLAVLRSSAVNQDGASNGLTAPNGPAQQRVIRQALAAAGLSAADVDAVEAHGTGTKLGDPIEAQALLATYGQDRPADRPLWLGSLKSNIGHTQAAAGVGGVIKTVMALRHGVLPKTLHLAEPTSQVDWSEGHVRLLAEATPWPEYDRPRRAGVSSFGVSGTNAHLILEAPADPSTPTPAAVADPPTPAAVAVADGVVPWVLSGRTEEAVRAQARRLLDRVEADPALRPVDVAHSLLGSRAAFDRRTVVVGGDRDELVAGLRAAAAGADAATVLSGTARTGTQAVFVFPGQGAQWPGMAQDLYSWSPVFADSMWECARALAPFVDWSLEQVLGDGTALERVDVVQPVLWAVMVSLAAVWRSFGVVPAAVVGHSQGEIAAACVAGGLSLADGARVVALRSRAIADTLAGDGGMVALPLSAARAEELLARRPGLWVAAVNGPASVVVAGDAEAVERLLGDCRDRDVQARRIAVDYASHSPSVERIERQLLSDLAPITPRSAAVPVYSSVTGDATDTAGWDAGYWYRNLRHTVRFEEALTAALAAGHGAVVEVSPHPVLLPAARDVADGGGAATAVLGTLRRDEGTPRQMLLAVAQAYAHGVAVDWTPVFAGREAARVALPTYAFQHQRYWPESASGQADVSAAGLNVAEHPLLGAVVPAPDSDAAVFTGRLSLRTHPWLADHAVRESVVFPGTGFVELAIRAGDSIGCDRVEELVLEAPLMLPAHGGVQVQVVVGDGEDEESRRSVAVYARPDGEDTWTRHATGFVDTVPPGGGGHDLSGVLEGAWPPAGVTPVDTEEFYERLREGGFLRYGLVFQGLRKVWRVDDLILAEVELPESVHDAAESFGIHPALLDAAQHAAAFAELGSAETGGLPFSYGGVVLRASGAARLRVALTRTGPDEVTIAAADSTGAPVLSVASMTMRPVAVGELDAGTGDRTLLRTEWADVSVPAEASPARWLTVGRTDEDHTGTEAVAAALDGGLSAPDAVVLTASGDPERVVGSTHELTGWVLRQLQYWLDQGRFEPIPLVVAVRGAVAARPGETVPDLAAAAVWGLVRSAQTENPGRIVLLDIGPRGTLDAGVLGRALAADEPQLALRDGQLLAARLTRVGPADQLPVPPETTWRLDSTDKGALENLALLPGAESTVPLAPGQVRVQVHAAGLNFRDVLNALDMVHDARAEGPLGGEVAGVVTGVGPGVSDLRPGDRVMGLVSGAFGPLAVTDRRFLAEVPTGWSFATAASVPIVFLTAYYGLVDLAELGPGESVLVHAGAGGVGMAAIQLARHRGAEVYATASEGKQYVLREWGIPAGRLASSRDLGFREAFRDVGVNVVLNSLAGEFVDASLDLLAPGGRFLEMGKTDIRSPEDVRGRPVSYRAFDLMDAGADRIQEMLRELMTLFEAGLLRPLPLTAWDVRRAPEAFRYMSQAKHTGKIVLTVPQPLTPDGTVLLTGGTGGLGGVLARHLVAEHGVRHLLLVSRRGANAPGAADLVDELTARGAEVTVAACDVTDRQVLAGVLASVPPEHPLTGVVHTAGILDDGVLGTQTQDRLDRVLAPKADAAWHLHELTRHLDLSLFAVYSSVAGHLGNPGQANYVAANVFLDALMQRRRHEGLPGLSMAWGAWSTEIGMVGSLSRTDLHRIARSPMPPLSAPQGMDLFDRAVATGFALLVLTRLDPRALRAQPDLAPLWRSLAGGAPRRTADNTRHGRDALRQRLAALSRAERQELLTGLVGETAATVLGHGPDVRIEEDRPFSELGFDSLTAVELRNLLKARTGAVLAASAVFDYPTVARLAHHVGTFFGADGEGDVARPAEVPEPSEAAVRAALRSIPLAKLREARLLDALLDLARDGDEPSVDRRKEEELLLAADVGDLVDIALRAE